MINGGIGILLAGNTRRGAIGYGVVAALMWLAWMAISISSGILRLLRGRKRGDKTAATTTRRGPFRKRNAPTTTAPIAPPMRALTPPLPTASGGNKIEHYS